MLYHFECTHVFTIINISIFHIDSFHTTCLEDLLFLSFACLLFLLVCFIAKLAFLISNKIKEWKIIIKLYDIERNENEENKQNKHYYFIIKYYSINRKFIPYFYCVFWTLDYLKTLFCVCVCVCSNCFEYIKMLSIWCD